MRVATVFATLLLGLGTIAGETGSPSWEIDLRDGLQLMLQQHYAEARRRFTRVTELNPRSSKAFFYLGMSALHSGDSAAAEAALRHSVQLDPKALNAVYNLGVVLLDRKKPADAARYFEQAVAAGPASPEVAVHLIQAYLESGQKRRAVEATDAASQQFSSMADFQAITGKLLLTHGLPSEACAALERAFRLEPRAAEIAIPTAAACLESKNLDASRAALHSIGAKDRENVEYRSLAAKLYLASGEKEAALEEMSAAIRLKPGDPLLLLALARFHQKFGEQQQALAILDNAARLNPQLPEIPYSMAVSYITADDEPEALRLLNQALRLNPHFHQALFLAGSIHLAGERLDEAEKFLLQALDAQPGNAYYRCFVGMLRAAQNRGAEAEAEFREAIRVAPSYALVHFQLGKTLAKEGNSAAAISELERAVALQADLAEAHYQLALLYRKSGQTEKGEQALARFKALNEAAATQRAVVLKQLQETLQ